MDDDQEAEGLSLASTASSSGRVSRVSEIWCILHPCTACRLLSFLTPPEVSDFASCCLDHLDHVQLSLVFLALQVLASFLQLCRRLDHAGR